jgi:hypothetical protein
MADTQKFALSVSAIGRIEDTLYVLSAACVYTNICAAPDGKILGSTIVLPLYEKAGSDDMPTLPPAGWVSAPR